MINYNKAIIYRLQKTISSLEDQEYLLQELDAKLREAHADIDTIYELNELRMEILNVLKMCDEFESRLREEDE